MYFFKACTLPGLAQTQALSISLVNNEFIRFVSALVQHLPAFSGGIRNIMRREIYRTGRLTAKPGAKPVSDDASIGTQTLRFNSEKESLLYVPKGYDPNTPASLAVMLHGSGGIAAHGLSYLNEYADQQNIILLAPASQDYTWDIIAGNSFDKDVIYLDRALQFVFERYAVDAEHIAIGGFSDGASYGLCLGLTNGDLFKYIIAFSPGFSYVIDNHGDPAVFISHGVHDRILPINSCSRRIVPQLKKRGLQVIYHEFDGEHEMPPNIRQEAIQWFIEKEKQQSLT
jgi:phospholipase/carboxylesterase